MMKTNYHTHSTFCDGKNTAEEMVEAAIAKSFDVLGFSSHSMYPFSSDWHLPARNLGDYVAEIRRLKEKYSGKIEILAGFEADYIAGVSAPDFDRYNEFSPDFIIGSVHYVPGNKGFIEADGSRKSVDEGIRKYFGGDVKACVLEYLALEREMLEKNSFTFLGHPDLITMQNMGTPLFDETESWYRQELKVLSSVIAKSGVCVEVNTGGMARKGLPNPYPSPWFMEHLASLKVPFTLNSDAHTASGLDHWFEEGRQYIKKAGSKELAYISGGELRFELL